MTWFHTDYCWQTDTLTKELTKGNHLISKTSRGHDDLTKNTSACCDRSLDENIRSRAFPGSDVNA